MTIQWTFYSRPQTTRTPAHIFTRVLVLLPFCYSNKHARLRTELHRELPRTPCSVKVIVIVLVHPKAQKYTSDFWLSLVVRTYDARHSNPSYRISYWIHWRWRATCSSPPANRYDLKTTHVPSAAGPVCVALHKALLQARRVTAKENCGDRFGSEYKRNVRCWGRFKRWPQVIAIETTKPTKE